MQVFLAAEEWKGLLSCQETVNKRMAGMRWALQLVPCICQDLQPAPAPAHIGPATCTRPRAAGDTLCKLDAAPAGAGSQPDVPLVCADQELGEEEDFIEMAAELDQDTVLAQRREQAAADGRMVDLSEEMDSEQVGLLTHDAGLRGHRPAWNAALWHAL